jgi:hypothetical protein
MGGILWHFLFPVCSNLLTNRARRTTLIGLNFFYQGFWLPESGNSVSVEDWKAGRVASIGLFLELILSIMFAVCSLPRSHLRRGFHYAASPVSLVELRVCAAIHAISELYLYLTTRPSFSKGGPPPQQRSLFILLSLTRRTFAASLLVRRVSASYTSSSVLPQASQCRAVNERNIE